MNAAEIEIAIHRRNAESYNVDLRFVHPESEADTRPGYGDLEPLRIDHDAWLGATSSAEQGRVLTQCLIVQTKLQAAFEEVDILAGREGSSAVYELTVTEVGGK
ncbi:MAG: hypothetical protein AAF702_26065 [Chloroflexota bacterium]